MPIKKDGTGKRWVEMELLVPGTPEEVWRAMASGPGNSAWFTETRVEERVGGKIGFDLGGSTSEGDITTWEPPRRFGYVEHGWAEGAPPVATDITIESRAGGRCVVRMVHSLFTSSDEWDDQVEGFESGWPGFFAVLRVYLARFAGQGASSFHAMCPSAGDPLAIWTRFAGDLGISGANVDELRTCALGFDPWRAVVEHVYQDARQRYVLLRIYAPAPGIALVGTHSSEQGTSVGLCRYYYGDDAAGRRAEGEPRWRAWLEKEFGSARPS
jgi:uncharacterized protein YndB with AHSA1/START domain